MPDVRYNIDMIIALILVSLIVLLAAASVVPHRSTLSEFELRRRLGIKQQGAMLQWRRGELYAELMAVRRVVIAFLLVLTSALVIYRFGWWLGLGLAFVLTLAYNRLASLPPVRGVVQRLYNRHEAGLLRWLDKYRKLVRPLRGAAERQVERHLGSRDEMLHIIDQSVKYFDEAERAMLRGATRFTGKLVRDYMTPRSRMEAIGANELLGPLVLDDLYKTKHSHFPVFEGDLDHLVGMLHIHALFGLGSKASPTVRDVMVPQVLYIHQDQPLSDALAACIKHRRHLLIVINEFEETVGVITIEDAVAELLGRPIEDVYSDHDQRAAVAARGSKPDTIDA